MTNQEKAEQLVDEELSRYLPVGAASYTQARRLAIMAALNVLGLSFEAFETFEAPDLFNLVVLASEAIHLQFSETWQSSDAFLRPAD